MTSCQQVCNRQLHRKCLTGVNILNSRIHMNITKLTLPVCKWSALFNFLVRPFLIFNEKITDQDIISRMFFNNHLITSVMLLNILVFIHLNNISLPYWIDIYTAGRCICQSVGTNMQRKLISFTNYHPMSITVLAWADGRCRANYIMWFRLKGIALLAP